MTSAGDGLRIVPSDRSIRSCVYTLSSVSESPLQGSKDLTCAVGQVYRLPAAYFVCFL